MQGNKTATSEMISLLRFPMAVCVVLVHCFFFVKGWHYDKLAEQGLGSNVVAELLLSARILSSFVVALFYLISGYLFFLHLHDWDGGVWKQKMTRRIWTLLIPYVIWNILYVIFMIGPTIANCVINGTPWDDVNTWVNDHGGWLGLFWNAKSLGKGQVDLWGHPAHATVPILMPFYFIRDLIVVNLFSPLFHYLLRSRQKAVSPCAVVTLVVLAFAYLTQTSFIIPGFSVEAFFFYGVGAFMSINCYELSWVFYAKRWHIAIVTLCLFLAELCEGFLRSRMGTIIYPFFVVFELMTVVNIASWLVKRKSFSKRMSALKNVVTRWQNMSFMIFAFHYFLLHDVVRLLNKVGGALTGFYDVKSMEMCNHHPFLVMMIFLLRIVIIVSACMIVYQLMRKYLPRTCRLLCGR